MNVNINMNILGFLFTVLFLIIFIFIGIWGKHKKGKFDYLIESISLIGGILFGALLIVYIISIPINKIEIQHLSDQRDIIYDMKKNSSSSEQMAQAYGYATQWNMKLNRIQLDYTCFWVHIFQYIPQEVMFLSPIPFDEFTIKE